MTKTRVTRTSKDLLAQVTEQIDLLVSYCSMFDAGKLAMAKPMATALRVLLHTSEKGRGRSRALLDQARLRDRRWYDAARPFSPGNLGSECGLIVISVPAAGCGPDEISHWTAVLPRPESGLPRRLFADWWIRPVARNPLKKIVLSRMDIVRNIADTDGGAHVDQSLDEDYDFFRNGEFLGHRAEVGKNSFSVVIGNYPSDAELSGEFIPDAHLASVRTIAHEMLLTLNKRDPTLFKNKYEYVADAPEGGE